MKKVINWIFISFILAGCFSKKTTENFPVIDVVNNIGNYQRVYCSDFFSSIELVPLETKKECLVQYPFILLKDSFIFIAVGGQGGVLYVFDRNGKFLNQIGVNGRGPGEYLSLNNVFLNQHKSTIFVADLYNIV